MRQTLILKLRQTVRHFEPRYDSSEADIEADNEADSETDIEAL